MFIKNQRFSDEDTLLEAIFDFSLGEETPVIKQLRDEVEAELAENIAYADFIKTLTDEEDREEAETEERRIRLAEKLMARFVSFEIKEHKLYGLNGDQKELLYEIDLY